MGNLRAHRAIGAGLELTPAAWRHLLVLGLVLLLNIVDGCLTLRVVHNGWGWERNPLMRALLEQGAGYFLGVKLAVCASALALLWLARQRSAARLAAAGVALLYAGVVGYALLNLAG